MRSNAHVIELFCTVCRSRSWRCGLGKLNASTLYKEVLSGTHSVQTRVYIVQQNISTTQGLQALKHLQFNRILRKKSQALRSCITLQQTATTTKTTKMSARPPQGLLSSCKRWIACITLIFELMYVEGWPNPNSYKCFPGDCGATGGFCWCDDLCIANQDCCDSKSTIDTCSSSSRER